MLMPQGLLGEGGKPHTLTQLLEAMWAGWEKLQAAGGADARGRPAAREAFVECLCWSLNQVKPGCCR